MNDEVQAQATEPNAVALEYIDNLAARVKGIVALTLPFAQEALVAIRYIQSGSQEKGSGADTNAETGEMGISFEAATRLVRQRPLVVLGVAAACVFGAYAVVRRRARLA